MNLREITESDLDIEQMWADVHLFVEIVNNSFTYELENIRKSLTPKMIKEIHVVFSRLRKSYGDPEDLQASMTSFAEAFLWKYNFAEPPHWFNKDDDIWLNFYDD